MEDCFSNWTEEEKDAFMSIFEIEPDMKALQAHLVTTSKRLGRDSGSKVRSLYYSGLLLAKKLCQNSGIPLEHTLPDSSFFSSNRLDLKLLSPKFVNKEIKRLSKTPRLLSVIYNQNCMTVLSMAFQTKPSSSIGIRLHSEPDVLCQFCGKPRRMGNSFFFQGVPECLALQLLPFKAYYHKALVRNGFNPRLELYLPPNKLLAEVIEHLGKKWNPSYIENSGQEFTIGLMAPWQGKHIEYTKSQEKITIGDVYMSLENPTPLQMFYYWKPLTQTNELAFSENSLNSASMMLHDENSNSLPFLNSTFDHKPVVQNSPFKTLFKSTESPFSKNEQFAEPKETNDIRIEGEDSMFSSFFCIKEMKM